LIFSVCHNKYPCPDCDRAGQQQPEEEMEAQHGFNKLVEGEERPEGKEKGHLSVS
jgi:hypothetical protein